MDREKMSVMDLTVPCVCCGHENTLYDLSDPFNFGDDSYDD